MDKSAKILKGLQNENVILAGKFPLLKKKKIPLQDRIKVYIPIVTHIQKRECQDHLDLKGKKKYY